MAASEADLIPHRDVDSTAQSDHHQQAKHGGSAAEAGENHHPFSSLGRQSSIYSLTLDEFQHALCESGKNFGSMNMDEFLVSIWNAEENQQATATQVSVPANGNGFNYAAMSERIDSGGIGSSSGDMSNGKRGITKQPSLPRQGSLSLPAPLCRKTVDEVWSEIHRGKLRDNNNGDNNGNSNNGTQNPENTARQPTFGEMTLEDFLIKAGVVREQTTNTTLQPNQTPIIPAQQQQHYGVFQSAGGPSFPGQPMAVVGDTSGFMNNGKRTGGGGYAQVMPTQPGVCYSGRLPAPTSGGIGAGGYVPGQQVAAVGPLSPVSSDGLGHGQVDNMGSQFGVDMNSLRGRKRIVDGPVEKVVERRQRRMIKNRESAARSRARKQAYTVELEAELNQLKEENAQLKHALAELERKRKKQYSEDTKTKTPSKSHKANDRLRTLRRNTSCPL